MKEQKLGLLDLKPSQLHELEKQKNFRYNWNQPGVQNAYSKFQLGCQKRVLNSPEAIKKDPIVQKPEIDQPKISRKQVESYIQSSELRKETPRGRKHTDYNPAIQSKLSQQEEIQKPKEIVIEKPKVGTQSIYEQKKGLKIYNNKQKNPITQDHIKLQVKAPRFPAEPSAEMTKKLNKAYFLGGGESADQTRQPLQSPTFNSHVFNFNKQGVDEIYPKSCKKNSEKKTDTLGGIISYDSGPAFKNTDISKPVDITPNQMTKECRQILQEKIENKNYCKFQSYIAGFKDRMLNHQWNLG